MPIICPAILGEDEDQYKAEMERISGFAHRIQIDLTDGQFAAHKTISPEKIWWPAGVKADIHVMYQQPMAVVHQLIKHRPSLIIIHAEAEADFQEFVVACTGQGIRVGIALLQETPVDKILPALPQINHVLIFSGELGQYGGRANLELLNKSSILRSHKPELEIGWDGGVDDQNVSQLVFGGIDVLNVGGFIQKASDPKSAYESLRRIVDETGTT